MDSEAASSAEPSSQATALPLALHAVALGLLGSGLLYQARWGLNLALWTLAIVVSMGLLRSQKVSPFQRDTTWLFVPLLLLVACFSWRDSSELHLANGAGIVLLLGIISLRIHTGRPFLACLSEYTLGVIAQWGRLLPNCVRLFLSSQFKSLPSETTRRRIQAIVRGLLIALPLLFVFGVLMIQADAVFEDLIETWFSWDIERVLSQGFLALVLTIFVGGLYGGWFLRHIVRPPTAQTQRSYLGGIEIGIVLGSMILLFGSFVAIQMQFLFGGQPLVQETAGLTYAEYARRGFFELLSLVGFSACLLLALHHRLEKSAKTERLFAILGYLWIALLFVVIASAFFRMNVYVQQYGLTARRLYASAGLAWIGFLLLWLGATVLRGRSHLFAFGAALSAVLCILGLNVLDPDALMARINLGESVLAQRSQATHEDRQEQYQEGNGTDLTYLRSLSADAVPTLLKGLDRLPPIQRETLSRHLAEQEKTRRQEGWRSWNLGRSHARRALEAQKPSLQASVR